MTKMESGPDLRQAFTRSAQEAGTKRPRHRPNNAGTFSIRLNEEERRFLRREAGKLPLGTYIRQKLIGDEQALRRPGRAPKKLHKPRADQVSHARILAMLGRSEVYKSLNAIAKAALMGSLPVTPELLDELHRACADVYAMRTALLRALQVETEGEHDPGR